MMEFSLWKQIKKRLRRNRRPHWMLGSIVLYLLVFGHNLELTESVQAAVRPEEQHQNIIQTLLEQKEPLSVNMHIVYVCGEEDKPLGRMMPSQLAELLLVHPNWKAVLDKNKDSVLLEQRIDDLSEHCKLNAYMGMDKAGNLTLYDGVPKKEKVVRTFFQLDVRFMESSLPQDKLDELANGIRINDIDEYNSVLSTYSDYAKELNEKVMKPTY